MVTSKKPGVLSRLGGHTRRNLIAYLALFVALGGTSAYAAKALITGAQIGTTRSEHRRQGRDSDQL